MPAITCIFTCIFPDRRCPCERRFRVQVSCLGWQPSLLLGFAACARVADIGGMATDARENKAEAWRTCHEQSGSSNTVNAVIDTVRNRS